MPHPICDRLTPDQVLNGLSMSGSCGQVAAAQRSVKASISRWAKDFGMPASVTLLGEVYWSAAGNSSISGPACRALSLVPLQVH